MRTRVVIAGLFLAIVVTSCGEAEAACGDPFAEPLDSKSSTHLLPGVAEPKYRTDPPTSGAHRVGEISAGVSEREIPKPEQVHLLEEGRVLVQYSDELPEDDLDNIRSFAGENVVVAPNDSLREPIVATAWLHKLECKRIDFRVIQEFIDDYVEKAPGH